MISVRIRKRGENMAQRRAGRPPSDHPLVRRIFVRVSDETREKLDACMRELKLSCSDVVRLGIDRVYDSLKK